METKEVHIRILETALASLRGLVTKEQMTETISLCQQAHCTPLLHKILFDTMQTLTCGVVSVTTEQNYKEMINDNIPVGYITGWAGRVDTIPPGWARCDGKNGTHDLREKFPDILTIQKIKTKGE